MNTLNVFHDSGNKNSRNNWSKQFLSTKRRLYILIPITVANHSRHDYRTRPAMSKLVKIIFVLGVALGLADAVSRSLFCQVSKVTEVDLQFDTVGLTIGQ